MENAGKVRHRKCKTLPLCIRSCKGGEKMSLPPPIRETTERSATKHEKKRDRKERKRHLEKVIYGAHYQSESVWCGQRH